MIELVSSVAAFLVAILLLVTIHEFGHFWVARKLGVKVLRFSIGFGRVLFSWRRPGDETEYVIAAIPLGGYVKMLDEREDDVPPRERSRAFNNQALWKRSAIVAAGPMANFLLAILLYWGLLMVGEDGLRPEVGSVESGSIAAEAGFVDGDLVSSVNDRSVGTWGNFWFALLSASLSGDSVSVAVQTPEGDRLIRYLPAERLETLDPGRGFLAQVGLLSPVPVLAPVLGEVVSGEPAETAGLRPGDRVLAVDGEPIETWRQLVEAIRDRPGTAMTLRVARDDTEAEVSVVPAVVERGEGRTIGRIGAGPEVPEDLFADLEVRVHYGPVEAMVESFRRVGDLSVLTLRIAGRMLVGTASIENLSSPIGIADAAGKTARFGVEPYLEFLALLSVSLGLLNLLPIPVLDGGHLLYFAFEAVRGRPLSDEAQAQGQRVGLLLIVALMCLAFYVDIARFLG
jgi:regulator of sigma E protease